MNPPTRDDRRERRTQNAATWAAYVTTALAEHDPPLQPIDLVKRSGGVFDTGKVSHWTNGDNSASADSALLFAQILGRDLAEALRAAGHHAMADAFAQLPTPPSTDPPIATAPPARTLADAALSLLREKGADLPDEELSAAERQILNQTMMIEDYIHVLTELKRHEREHDDTRPDGDLGAS